MDSVSILNKIKDSALRFQRACEEDNEEEAEKVLKMIKDGVDIDIMVMIKEIVIMQ